jgi:EAL domain-containing protein (putative c-di-GMP-specific phosphodiesterase class I)
VFAQAARSAQRWNICIGETFQVSINKSPVQLVRRAVDTDSLRHLNTMQFAGNHIAVEITKGVLYQSQV